MQYAPLRLFLLSVVKEKLIENRKPAMLGPRPGARKRANKLNVSGLGRSLVNQKKKEQPTSDRYTTEMNYGSQSALRSVTEQRPLDELLATAELAGKDFTTERTAAVRVVTPRAGPSAEERALLVKQHYENAGRLTVPRRPKWTREMSAIELDSLEKDAFLAWRRELAALQENEELRLALTPFERNLEVWRQLWRVLERSHLVVQIVDARNPLLYRSADLDAYVHELGGKNTLLLVNKADLLSERQRELWRNYFVDHGIAFAFYSAKAATEESSASESQGDTPKPQDELVADPEQDSESDVSVPADNDNLKNTTRILTVHELQELFASAAPPVEGQLNVGLVGYPNVGKSSSINSLIGSKKVSVSATPGKTKHFQTIQLSPEVMLCDCPGLVFPNFAQTKAELVCQGVLPIDQLRDYMAPAALLTERIPKVFLEQTYGIKLHTEPVTALDLLNTYAQHRGFTRTGGGEPDASRAARLVLKDYVNARLPFCVPPPDYSLSAQEFNSETLGRAANATEVIEGVGKLQLQEQEFEDELDREFFNEGAPSETTKLPFHQKQQPKSSKKHFKGKKGARTT